MYNILELNEKELTELKVIAKELGISKSTLLNIEQNHANLTLDTVDLIAGNMGLDPQFLLFQSDPTSLTAAMLVMKFLGPENPYGLDTVQQILNHMQVVVNILSAAQQKDTSPKDINGGASR